MRKNPKPGRPAFSPTAAHRRKVSIAAGAGMSNEQIAMGLGISRNTLEKHFRVELSEGAYSRRLDVLDAMHKMAVKGNVAAQKAYVALGPASSAAGSALKPKGKKEQANEEAASAAAGTDWDDLIGEGTNVTPLRKKR